MLPNSNRRSEQLRETSLEQCKYAGTRKAELWDVEGARLGPSFNLQDGARPHDSTSVQTRAGKAGSSSPDAGDSRAQ